MRYDKRGRRYLSYAEFAEKHGVKETTVRQWAHRGIVLVQTFGLSPHIWEDEPIVYRKNGRPRAKKPVTENLSQR